MHFIRLKAANLARRLFPEIEQVKDAHIHALEQIIQYSNQQACRATDTLSLTIVIFSKDRAIQLHALLASFFDLAQGQVLIKVLYTASSKEHDAAYEELISLCTSRPEVCFEKEKDFRADLIQTLAAIDSSRIMFLVDDILFKEPVDLIELLAHNTNSFVPTLRMGNHLSYSYTTRQHQELPQFQTTIAPTSTMLVWKWQDGQLDWKYPLSVDGHIFDTAEIRFIIGSIQFKAPNSLEEGMQLYNPIFQTRYGVALQSSVIMNIPNNKVQNENDNHAGTLTADDLLRKWQEGYQIDYRKLRHFRNISAHQEVEFEFCKRNNRI
ncbi:hypothetical protein [Pontibacter sp. HSC-14F20]|uniref:hypothetical protein n=1 Tax=Pontibacter sp. HSC-14F20 TaxID=2864136 RepID=UPI001C73DAAA|nr:hypothetical protein [Pontibacter sp. HSC-14F20]